MGAHRTTKLIFVKAVPLARASAGSDGCGILWR
jgi:hypothetical protein